MDGTGVQPDDDSRYSVPHCPSLCLTIRRETYVVVGHHGVPDPVPVRDRDPIGCVPRIVVVCATWTTAGNAKKLCELIARTHDGTANMLH